MRDEAVGLVMPIIGKDCMQQHLDEIAKWIEPGNHGVIVLDRAAWHTIKKLCFPKNLSLLPTNSVSRIKSNRAGVASTKRLISGEPLLRVVRSILESCCEAWNAFISTDGAVRQLCSSA